MKRLKIEGEKTIRQFIREAIKTWEFAEEQKNAYLALTKGGINNFLYGSGGWGDMLLEKIDTGNLLLNCDDDIGCKYSFISLKDFLKNHDMEITPKDIENFEKDNGEPYEYKEFLERSVYNVLHCNSSYLTIDLKEYLLKGILYDETLKLAKETERKPSKKEQEKKGQQR